MTHWFRNHVLQLVTGVLTLILASAAVGTWTATVEFQRLQERIEQRDEQYTQRFRQNEQAIQRVRDRVRWLEQNRSVDASYNGLP